MKITDLIQSYTALTKSEVAGDIAKNIASSTPANTPSGTHSADNPAAIKTGTGSAALQQTDIPDSFQHKPETTPASRSLIGLRTPTAAGSMGLSAGEALNKLAASHIATVNTAEAEAKAETVTDSNTYTQAKDTKAREAINAAINDTISAKEARDSKNTQTATSQSRNSEVAFLKTALPGQTNANAFSTAEYEAKSGPQVMAMLLRHLTAQTTRLPGVIDSSTIADATSEEALQETEKTGMIAQHVDPRLPASKSTTTAYIPPQSASEGKNTDLNDPSIAQNARESVRENLSPAQAALMKALQAHALAEQTAAGQLHAPGRMELSGEMLLKALGNDQMMAQMHGMDAAILNAAMIPGWPAPRPFAMPRQLPSGQVQRTQQGDAETTGQLGTPHQSKGKEAQGRSETAIQNYLLNMGLKASLMKKLRKRLRPAKKKAKVFFGLAVLITQTVFALHTMVSELNTLEENEDEMMNDPSNQKRHLKG